MEDLLEFRCLYLFHVKWYSPNFFLQENHRARDTTVIESDQKKPTMIIIILKVLIFIHINIFIHLST